MAEVSAQAVPKQREYVMLISHDGFEFVLPRDAACQSQMLSSMLEGFESLGHATGDASSDKTNNIETMLRIPLDDIGGPVLDLVCQYLAEKRCCRSSMAEFKQLKALDPTKEEDKQLVLELLLAADYLNC